MRVIAAVAAGLLCAACSATVAGQGRFVPDATTNRPTTGSTSPTASPTPSPRPTPVRYDPGRAALACRGGTVVVPRGGPYCYLRPAGMRDVTGQVRLGAGTGAARYVSSVGLAGRDLIVVLVYRTPLNTDYLEGGRIVADLRGVLASLTRAGFVFASGTPQTSTVDRARAFTYHARSSDSTYQSDLTFVFRGRSQIEVLCQYANRKAAVQSACRQVLGTLQIKTVR
jgi:hypothetical protein